ncbi:hypothetical protein KC361_g167 [Hortaea werneckii]|nr:hypothetical protein KC361_g167 [Hortaea werneckii]
MTSPTVAAKNTVAPPYLNAEVRQCFWPKRYADHTDLVQPIIRQNSSRACINNGVSPAALTWQSEVEVPSQLPVGTRSFSLMPMVAGTGCKQSQHQQVRDSSTPGTGRGRNSLASFLHAGEKRDLLLHDGEDARDTRLLYAQACMYACTYVFVPRSVRRAEMDKSLVLLTNARKCLLPCRNEN